jgi:translation initiation factor IF-2
MADEKMIRLGQASRKLNVGHNTILEFLAKKGFSVENNPNAKLTGEQFAMLSKEYASSASEKLEASGLTIGTKHVENVTIEREKEVAKKRLDDEESIMIKNLGSKDLKAKEEAKPDKVEREKPKLEGIKVLGKIELEKKAAAEAPAQKEKQKEKEPEVVAEVKTPAIVTPPAPAKKKEEPVVQAPVVETVAEKQPEQELIKAKADELKGLKVVGRIELPAEKKKEAPSTQQGNQDDRKGKRPRKRIATDQGQPQTQQQGGAGQGGPRGPRPQQPQRGGSCENAKRRTIRKGNSGSDPRNACKA